MRHRGARAAIFAFVVTIAGTAAAQEAPPFDSAIDVQLFEYQAGPKTFLSVEDAAVASDKQLAFDFMVTFLSAPFVVYNVDDSGEEITTTRTEVVGSMFAGEVSGAYGLKDRYQIGVALPLVFSMSGEKLDPATATSMEGLQISGLGDLRGEIKARIWNNRTTALSGRVGLTLPSSFGAGGSDFIGDDLPTFRGGLAAQWTASNGKISAGANLGLILRKPRTIYASEIGQQFTYGLAAAFHVTDKFSVIGETFGRTGMTSFATDATPMEAGGGLRVLATKSIAFTLGASAGINKGIGSPEFRTFASVGYSPDTRDSDGDGVANNRDRCTSVPEDDDGYEDGDGCPDADNDGDRREDALDKCADESEDFDGFEDDDGCPELDNDGDGIADLQDRHCPMDKEDGQAPQPADGCPFDMRDTDEDRIFDAVDACFEQEEDYDSFEDWDGCPDLDQDKDGVADDEDRCPVCADDKDGFEDADGCPEIDNDSDGFLDADDQCPGEPEVVNGVDDWDGCGDEGGAEVATFDGDRVMLLAPVGFDKKGLTKAGTVILDQAALLMRAQHDVKVWMLAVAAKKDADARKQAAWVLQHLVKRGLAEGSLQILTSAGTPGVAIAVQERDEPVEDAAPVCPAGREIQQRCPDGGCPAAASAPDRSEPEPEPEPEMEPEPEPESDEVELD